MERPEAPARVTAGFIGYAITKDKPHYFVIYIEGKNIDGPLVRDKTVEIPNGILTD